MLQDRTLLFEKYSSIALRGDVLTREECREVLATPDSEILGLLHAAYEVRKQFAGNTVQVQMLTNAKSGACIEENPKLPSGFSSTMAILWSTSLLKILGNITASTDSGATHPVRLLKMNHRR